MGFFSNAFFLTGSIGYSTEAALSFLRIDWAADMYTEAYTEIYSCSSFDRDLGCSSLLLLSASCGFTSMFTLYAERKHKYSLVSVVEDKTQTIDVSVSDLCFSRE
jgi:hypothetical protein